MKLREESGEKVKKRLRFACRKADDAECDEKIVKEVGSDEWAFAVRRFDPSLSR